MNNNTVEMEIGRLVRTAQSRLPEGYQVVLRAGKYIIADPEGNRVFTPEEITVEPKNLSRELAVKHAFRRVEYANQELYYTNL